MILANIIHHHALWFVTVVVGILALAAAVGFLAVRRKRKSSNPNSETKPTAPKPAIALPPFQPNEPRIGTEAKRSPAWPNAPQSGGGISHDWAEFVGDRLDELDPKTNADETKWALGVVDFLDELKEADAEASVAEQTTSASLRASLLALLSSKGYEPVDSDEWNPDKQRTVSVVRNPDVAGTKILGRGSTGLSRNGKIIRKQEVKIEKKGN
ncbi:MAG: hypothetical protein IJV65_09490 [Kiritimatiellae bacterium]|nr:hypothetical protein [Kiritimatiellia bacterium]